MFKMLPCLVVALGLCGCQKSATVAVPQGNAERGELLVARYGCAACHALPGALNQGANVGPPLFGMARRGYIGGVLPNTPDNMVRWLQDPPQVDPRTAMPSLGVSAAEAADITAWLYTLK